MNIIREKKEWVHSGNNYNVEVCVWRNPAHDILESLHILGKYRWNIYIYIFKDHALFDKITSDSRAICINLPLHGGCTYHEWKYDKTGNPILKKIGCDYFHDDYDRFVWTDLREAVPEIFKDADELIKILDQ